MNAPKFNNSPNEHIQLKYENNGKFIALDYFISRAVAVVGVVFAIMPDDTYVLISKRSHKMRDEANKMCVPCGYLDWNEQIYEAMIREVFEETSFYIPNYENYLEYDNNKKPYEIKDNPTEDMRQNVSMLFLTVLNFSKNVNDFPFDIQKFSCSETQEVKWMKLSEFYATHKNYYWAFSHDKTIDLAFQHYQNIINQNEHK